jgi:hypothetical protein
MLYMDMVPKEYQKFWVGQYNLAYSMPAAWSCEPSQLPSAKRLAVNWSYSGEYEQEVTGSLAGSRAVLVKGIDGLILDWVVCPYA